MLEQAGAKWAEVLRCDEYLKNPNGYLGGTPLEPVTGWRLELSKQSGNRESENCCSHRCKIPEHRLRPRSPSAGTRPLNRYQSVGLQERPFPRRGALA